MARYFMVACDLALWLTVFLLVLVVCVGCARPYEGRVQDKGYSQECQTIAHRYGLDTHCRVIKRERTERY